MKRVISLWFPKFATDRLCRLRQDWLDNPLALVQEIGGKLLLHAVNAAADQIGIHAGMTLADARTILPELHTSEADTAAEARSLTRLAEWCGRFSPWTAPDEEGSGVAFAGSGSIWLDVTGCIHLFGSEDALMRNMTDRLTRLGFTTYAAIADTPGAAWAAVRHTRYKRRHWTIVRTGQTRDILSPMPVAGLRLSPAIITGLQATGLHQIGDLMPLPRPALANRFGSEVTDRLDQALGDRPEPVSPLAPANPWYVRIAFAEPVSQIESITQAVHSLAKDLTSMLEADGLGARHLILSFYHPDGTVDRLRAGTSQASRDADHLTRLLTTKLDRIETAFGIDTITLTVSASERLSSAQSTFYQHKKKKESDLAELADRLSNRLGKKNIVRLALQESHIPERAIATFPITAHRRSGRATPWRSGASFANRPRPLRLLPRPEEVEAVAPVPDDPPVMFRWRKQVFRVERSDGPERIATEWWNDGLDLLETEQKNINEDYLDNSSTKAIQNNVRDYYRVEDRRGQRFWVFREGIYGSGIQPQWYVHGVFG
ncbi:MAG: DNA polymerase Y family protein [Pseudomonadota bacterium]|nr:DNA polymerase Y family protein [Pseudomonadota bacterium]